MTPQNPFQPIVQAINRLFNGGTRLSPQDAELQRHLHHGDDARRQQHFDKALELYHEGLTLARRYDKPFAQSAFLGQIGALHTARKAYEQAEEAFAEAKALAERSNDPSLMARALLNQGAFALRRGDLPQAHKLLNDALEFARKGNDSHVIGLALGNLADVHLKEGNPTYALRLLRDAVPQAISTPQSASYLIGRMGQAHLQVGESDQGKKFLAQATQLAGQHGQSELELLWGVVMADQLYKENRLEDALTMYDMAEQLSTRLVNPPEEWDLLRSLQHRADALYRLNQAEKATQTAERGLTLARAAGNKAAEASILMTLGGIHQLMGRSEDAIQEFNNVLSLLSDGDRVEQARALIQLGSLESERGNNEAAMAHLQKALTVSGSDDPLGRAHTLRRIGMIVQGAEMPEKALEYWSEALTLFESVGDHTQATRLLCDIGTMRRAISGINAAMKDFERATVMLSHVKDAATRGVVLSNVANLYTDLGEVETARSFYKESIELARQTTNRKAESLRLGNFGWHYIMTGNALEGANLLEEALMISREVGDANYVAVQLNNLGLAHHEMRHYDKAEALHRQALTMIESDSKWGGLFRSNLGRTLLARGNAQEALSVLTEGLAISRKYSDRETMTRTLARLADVHLQMGNLEEAEKLAAEGQQLAGKLAYRKGQADALLVRAGVAAKQGNNEGHTRFLREAQRLYNILHDPIAEDLARTLKMTTA
ncbi:MAG TPA: tetratricopeptide repeat protein [Aggregatilineales bacterium]|nr:tetratricopeptide repeat protein [Anaerolineales bacterium]HRE48001.1 tetratricopeptide repeat protein [Aggregatilineales bacterium]